MEQRIFKFLDGYLGTEFFGITEGKETYIHSKKTNQMVMCFWWNEKNDNVTMFRSSKLTEFISPLFGLTNDETNKYVKEWFGDRANIKKVRDLLKFRNV
jgi:hypothetical protein